MKRGVVLVLVFTGCGRIAFDEIAVDIGCTSPAPAMQFGDNTVPCAPWGTASANKGATIVETGGHLVVTPSTTMLDSSAVCDAGPVPFTSAGVFAKIDATISGGTTLVGATASGATFVTAATTVRDDATATHSLTAFGADTVQPVDYDVASPVWLRVRPAPADEIGLRFDYSIDGREWITYATSAAPAPTSATLRLAAGGLGSAPASGSSKFASVNVCPP